MVEQGLGYELVDSREDDGPSLSSDGVLALGSASATSTASTLLAAFVTFTGAKTHRVANANYDRPSTGEPVILWGRAASRADVGERLNNGGARHSAGQAVGPKQYYLDGRGRRQVMAGLATWRRSSRYEDVRPYAVLENQ